ncbi:hypothetical protein, partial [Serratia marcescens]|uniref:hypothetical protein n=1 Tax=Serratia marcescens TaxID=615 RepID=UPI001982392E
FSKGYFGFDISGTIPFHRPTKWVQYRLMDIDSGLFSLSLSHGLQRQRSRAPARSIFISPPRHVFLFVRNSVFAQPLAAPCNTLKNKKRLSDAEPLMAEKARRDADYDVCLRNR